MKTMYTLGYRHNNFVVTHASCAQVHELPQSHCGDNWEGTLYSYCIYIYNIYIYIYIYIYVYIYIYIYVYIYIYIYLKYMPVLFSEKKDLYLVSKGVE